MPRTGLVESTRFYLESMPAQTGRSSNSGAAATPASRTRAKLFVKAGARPASC